MELTNGNSLQSEDKDYTCQLVTRTRQDERQQKIIFHKHMVKKLTVSLPPHYKRYGPM